MHWFSTPITLVVEATRPIHRKLLADARCSLDSGHDEMAIVQAQAAAEMCTESALTALLTDLGKGALVEPLLATFPAYDIGNERLQGIYNALAGVEVQKQFFWEKLKIHRQRRNAIVHKGEKCEGNEAQESINAVAAYIDHVERVLDARKAPSP